MNLVKIKCAFCNKEYFRDKGRFNEAKKFGWQQYCSKGCQDKAKTKKIKKSCGNFNCNKLFSRPLSQFKRSKSGFIFCSRSCAAKVNNRNYPKRKKQLIVIGQKTYFKTGFIICAKCGKWFQRITGKKYCSTECKRTVLRTYTPQQLIEIIRKKSHELKRVPTKRELRKIANCCVIVFGSWNNAVAAAGLKPNRSHDHRMYKRTNAKALDGHLCDSISELLIDNWLYKNNIPHSKNVSYPNTHHKADWEILFQNQRTFIEYFGLANDSPRYDRSIKDKKKICNKNKIVLIPIYHWELYPKKRFGKKIRRYFQKINRDLTSQTGGTCTLVLHSPSVAP